MLEFLISAANIVGLIACAYFACVFFAAARAPRTNMHQVRTTTVYTDESASARPDYYYVM